ncbi:MAG TPA: DedA family protein [Roseiarcus sp.]|nr:DedA family protein [Roseiarcus sp.]
MTLELLPHLQHVLATYGYFAVLVVVGMESLGVPIPGETALVAGAILAGEGKLNIYGVIAAAAAGATIGGLCGYWIGREFGFPIAYRYGRYVSLNERRLKLGQYLFLKHGGKIVFFGRFVALLRAFASFLAGVNRYNWEKFFLFNAAGAIVWASIFGAGGDLLGHAFERYARPVGVAALIAAVIGGVIAARFMRYHERALEDEAERAFPGPLVKPKA